MTDSVDYYLDFDAHFFSSSSYRLEGAERDADVQAVANEYRKLLTGEYREKLDAMFADELTYDDAMLGIFMDELGNVARREYAYSPILRKPVGDSNPLRVWVDELCEVSGVDSLEDHQRHYIGGRIAAHLVRLALPTPYVLTPRDRDLVERARNDASRKFAVDMVRYASTTNSERQDCSLLHQNGIGSEGEGVLLFWTLAPYAHLELTSKGAEPNESMGRIMKWALDASRRVRERGDHFPREHDFRPNSLGFYKHTGVLGFDERMPTHLMARLMGMDVAGKIE